jgi:hypothetical protein
MLEVCGFNYWLVRLLREYGCREVILIQPEKRSKRKTDRRDASALAELLWVNRDRLGSITKQGSAMARFILGQLVMHVLRRDPWMKAWYGRIKRRRGAKIARVAVMRRLSSASSPRSTPPTVPRSVRRRRY